MRLHLAHALHQQRRWPGRARALLFECYMHLLPSECLDRGCAVTERYREALRHVLDATWVLMAYDNGERPDALAASIKHYKTLDNKQQAALHAIRSSALGLDTQ